MNEKDERRRKKIDSILKFFEGNPNKVFSPVEVGNRLGFDPKLVASVVGRLVAQGNLTRIGRGKYRYVLSVKVDAIGTINEARSILKRSFGDQILVKLNIGEEFRDLPSFLEVLKQKFGPRLANTVLKQAISKTHSEEKVKAILNKLEL